MRFDCVNKTGCHGKLCSFALIVTSIRHHNSQPRNKRTLRLDGQIVTQCQATLPMGTTTLVFTHFPFTAAPPSVVLQIWWSSGGIYFSAFLLQGQSLRVQSAIKELKLSDVKFAKHCWDRICWGFRVAISCLVKSVITPANFKPAQLNQKFSFFSISGASIFFGIKVK